MRINSTAKFAIIGTLLGFATGIILGTLSAVITLTYK
jgi:ABC-type dipeptide/oligopeptide/nickel transport system permease component